MTKTNRPRGHLTRVSILATVVVIACHVTHGSKQILMQNFDPEKLQGKWYLQRLNTVIVDDVHPELACIDFTLKHDSKLQDLYAMSCHWFNLQHEYEETHFNILDDRTERARYYLESHKDKIAEFVLGTDYDNWLVAYGVIQSEEGKDSYYIATRSKSFPEQYAAAIDAVLTKNEVSRNWINVVNDGQCPEGH